MFSIYQFDEILWLRPESMHQWRQTDCLQIAHNYLTDSWNFFSPSINLYFSDNETSGKTAGEFPLLYYLVAVLWKIFGEHEYIYRIVTISFFSIGLWALYDLLKALLKDNFWALTITFFLFTSPVLVFYSNNFLPNVPAFSFVLVGWNFFYKYYHLKKIKYLYFSIGMLTLAGLFKMTAYISFILLGAYFLIDFINHIFFKSSPKIYRNIKQSIIPFLLSLFFIFSWYIYAEYFTNIHGGKYTFNGFWPLWSANKEQIDLIFIFIRDIISHQIFSSTALWIILGMGLFLILDYKKINKFIFFSLILLTFGCICFLILWFQALEHHDYYIINLLILPLFILISFIWHLRDNYLQIFQSKPFRSLFLIFVIFNAYYASNNIKMRYWDKFKINPKIASIIANKAEIDFWWYAGSHNDFIALNDIEAYNRSLGIKKNDLVAFIPDQGFSTSLYLMNQKGWTSGFGIENDPNIVPGEKLKDKIENKHLKYLFIKDPNSLKRSYLHPFLHTPIGSYKGVFIYSLKRNHPIHKPKK